MKEICLKISMSSIIGPGILDLCRKVDTEITPKPEEMMRNITHMLGYFTKNESCHIEKSSWSKVRAKVTHGGIRLTDLGLSSRFQ